jgi:hypothetical protein
MAHGHATTGRVHRGGAWWREQEREEHRRVTAFEVFRILGGEKRGDRSFLCHCPCGLHKRGDRHPSLSVKDRRDGRLLLFCFAGGDYRDIVSTLRARGLRV